MIKKNIVSGLFLQGKKRVSVLILILIIFNTLLYINTTGFDFLKDDYQLIVNNSRIKNFDSFINSVNTPFFSFPDHPYLRYWRPVTLFSFFIDYKIYGLNPAGFHLTNIIINTFCILIIFAIFILISGRDIFSFLIALFFSAHPSHAEVVSWISGRTDLLSSLFILLALFSFIYFITDKKRKVLYYFAAIIFFFFGLLSKENTIMFPLIASLTVPAIEFLNKKMRKISIGNFLSLTIPFWIIDIGYLFFHSRFSGIEGTLSEIIPYDITVVIKSIGVYGKMILFPFSNTPYFEMSLLENNSTFFYIFFLISLSLSVYIFINREKYPNTLFSALFLLLIIPVINPDIIPSYPQIALRFVYIPVLILGTFLVEMSSMIKNKQIKRTFLVFMLGVFCLMTYKSVGYTIFFKNQNSYYNDLNGLTAYHASDPSLLLPLALSTAQNGNIGKALSLTNRALQNNKGKKWFDAYENGNLLKANLLIASGKLEDGKKIAERIKKITTKKEVKYFSNLIIAKYYEKIELYDEALSFLNFSKEIADTHDINFRIALILWKKGSAITALIYAKKALSQDPSNTMYIRLVTALKNNVGKSASDYSPK